MRYHLDTEGVFQVRMTGNAGPMDTDIDLWLIGRQNSSDLYYVQDPTGPCQHETEVVDGHLFSDCWMFKTGPSTYQGIPCTKASSTCLIVKFPTTDPWDIIQLDTDVFYVDKGWGVQALAVHAVQTTQLPICKWICPVQTVLTFTNSYSDAFDLSVFNLDSRCSPIGTV